MMTPLELWISLIAVIVLIVSAAILSAAETGITAASKARLHRLGKDGNARAVRVEKLIDSKERLIGSVLVGNNLINIAASALTTSVLIGVFGQVGVIYATLVLTIVIIIFGEILPKTYAITRPDRVALALGPAVGWFADILGPILRFIQHIVAGTLKLFGVRIGEKTTFFSSAEEIRGAIDVHVQEGGLEKGHKHMLGSILDLDEVTLADIMVHRKAMETIDGDLPAEEIIRQVVKSSHTRLPLWRENPDNIVGVIHSKDVLRSLSRRGMTPEKVRITTILSKPWFVPDTTTLREQMNAFIAKRQHFALVVDEYGSLQGLVTLEDILEEIVGDITDEFDTPIPPGVTVHADGTVTVEGAVAIRDLNRRFDWMLPDEEATTIAGLVINAARIIPVKGQTFTFFGFRFDVMERHRNQVTLLRITPPSDANASQAAA
jgi:Mg2+/Co2+ transporter CorB